jgi:hypothetical protein
MTICPRCQGTDVQDVGNDIVCMCCGCVLSTQEFRTERGPEQGKSGGTIVDSSEPSSFNRTLEYHERRMVCIVINLCVMLSNSICTRTDHSVDTYTATDRRPKVSP